MSDTTYLFCALLVTAVCTYGLRAFPLVLWKKEIEAEWVNSFFYYVPWAVLTAMVVPAVFEATSSPLSAAIGIAGAVLLACAKRSMITVSLGAGVIVWLVEAFIL